MKESKNKYLKNIIEFKRNPHSFSYNYFFNKELKEIESNLDTYDLNLHLMFLCNEEINKAIKKGKIKEFSNKEIYIMPNNIRKLFFSIVNKNKEDLSYEVFALSRKLEEDCFIDYEINETYEFLEENKEDIEKNNYFEKVLRKIVLRYFNSKIKYFENNAFKLIFEIEKISPIEENQIENIEFLQTGCKVSLKNWKNWLISYIKLWKIEYFEYISLDIELFFEGF